MGNKINWIIVVFVRRGQEVMSTATVVKSTGNQT